MYNLAKQQQVLLKRDSRHETVFSIWVGISKETATQLLNTDGSVPMVRTVQPSDQAIALDSNIQSDTEFYKVTWVHNLSLDQVPDANVGYWLSTDGGTTKLKLGWVSRQLRNSGAFWWIFLKRN